MRWLLLKKDKEVIARAEPLDEDRDMVALIVMHVNPGEDLFGVPYQQLFDAAPGLFYIDEEKKVLARRSLPKEDPGA